MRLARGNQAPLEFSSRTTISLSYALLSVCIGASATPKRLAGRRFQRFGARRGRRVDARGAVNRWRGHALPLGPSGSGFRGRRATDLVGEDLFDGDALASNRREFHSTVWCCDDEPETFGEAYDLLSTHGRRYGTVYVLFGLHLVAPQPTVLGPAPEMGPFRHHCVAARRAKGRPARPRTVPDPDASRMARGRPGEVGNDS